jgi:uncharacterized RDD family membrane protein YckC
MAKLNFMDRENLLRELEIDEELITIGREATNKLVIADPSVSRQHAWVEKREDGYYLVDKNSSNGSYVNGKKITQQKLSHNDKVQLGNAQLVFEDEEQVQATFILPREGLSPEILEPNKTQADAVPLNPDERPTSAVDVSPTPPQTPKPQPPPPPAPAPPPTPAPSVAPPPPAPKVETLTTCPSCKKPIEPGARFCGSCGAQIPAAAPAKPFAPPPPPPSAKPPMPPSEPPKPAPGPPPPAPSYGGPPHPLTHGFQPPAAPAPGPARTGRQEYAGFGVRLVAYLIDAVIFNLLTLLPGALIFFAQTQGDSTLGLILLVVASVAILLMAIFYWVILPGKKGFTPGKKIMKLKIIGADGAFPIGIGKAFLRLIMQSIGGSICGLTYWMILFDKEMHRALHDKVAGTLVIRES